MEKFLFDALSFNIRFDCQLPDGLLVGIVDLLQIHQILNGFHQILILATDPFTILSENDPNNRCRCNEKQDGQKVEPSPQAVFFLLCFALERKEISLGFDR